MSRSSTFQVKLQWRLPLVYPALAQQNFSSLTRTILAKVAEEQERIDVIINNAGFTLTGAVDDLCIEKSAKALFDTNLWGIARMVKAAMPHFRKQGHGQIINVSSVGGLIGFPFQEYYCASKWAVEGYTESLAISNSKLNIKVPLSSQTTAVLVVSAAC
jgi:short-subunit dehydrogenase